MENLNRYIVAGHAFSIELPAGYTREECLGSYEPFLVSEDVYGRHIKDSAPSDFTLKVGFTEDLHDVAPGDVKEVFNDEAPYFWLFERDGAGVQGGWFFGFSYRKNCPDCILIPSEDYRDNSVYVRTADARKVMEFAVSNAMMLLYTFRTTPYDTLMVHASVISHDGGGYMFLGKSGTGKSTHSRLWLENIDDTELLNDDNPVIRVIDGEAYVFGTPWSGKTPCYKNMKRPLRAVVRLSQAPFNKIVLLPPLQAYASLMPACSCMRWDRMSTDALHKTVENVIMRVAGWHLECLPDAGAASVCHSAVTQIRK